MKQQERILIVDDEAHVRNLLREKLTKEDYICEEAETAEQALNVLQSRQTELVILDTKMPGKSGVDLLLEIKAGYPDTGVIMATAITETSVAINCVKQGADDYICKPLNLDDVVLNVKRTLEKRKLQLRIKEYQQHLEHKVEEQTREIQLRIKEYQQQLELRIKDKTKELRKLFLGAIESLVFSLEARNKYTAGHSKRVTAMAMAIGTELRLAEDDLEDLRWASLLHDVGKVAVDQLIQNRPAKLTREEYEHIMIHAYVAAGIVKPVVNERVVNIILHHHDHYDGTGHDQLLARDQIPLGARILALADAFDAMTSERPYRPVMSTEEALNEVKRCTSSQFDPAVVTAFLSARTRLARSLKQPQPV